MPAAASQWWPRNHQFRPHRRFLPILLPQRQGRIVTVAEIANRGDPGAQRGRGVPSRPSHQHRMGVAGQILWPTVGVPAQMRMRIHQTRQQSRFTQINQVHIGAGGTSKIDRADPTILDHDQHGPR